MVTDKIPNELHLGNLTFLLFDYTSYKTYKEDIEEAEIAFADF